MDETPIEAGRLRLSRRSDDWALQGAGTWEEWVELAKAILARDGLLHTEPRPAYDAPGAGDAPHRRWTLREQRGYQPIGTGGRPPAGARTGQAKPASAPTLPPGD